MNLYATRKYGPGFCRNGHKKDYAGDCRVCLDMRNERKRASRGSRRELTITEADVQADVQAMRERVAARRAREQARSRVLAGR